MDAKIFQKLLDEALKPIIGRLDGIDGRFDGIDKRLDDPKTGLPAINNRLGSIEQRLDDPKTGLKRINEKVDVLWDQVTKVTENQEDMKDTLKSHTVQLKRIAGKFEENSDKTTLLNKRLTTIERKSGIIPPPELTF